MNISNLWIPKLLLILILAIVCGRMGYLPDWQQSTYLIFLSTLSLAYFFIQKKEARLLMTFSFIFLLGFTRVVRENISQNTELNPYLISNQEDSIALKILGDVQVKPSIAKATALVLRINDSILKAPEKVLLSLVIDSNSSDISSFLPGTEVLLLGKIQGFKNSEIPGSFSSKEHYSKKGLHYRITTKKGKWKIYSLNATTYSILKWSKKIQNLGLNKINNWPGNSSEKQVLAALLLGNKDELDPEISKAFSQTGLIHILAVSGLHVGIIFLVLNSLFKQRFWRPPHRFYRFIGILLGLWMYAFVSGLSPSVLRATIMFSFISLGNVLYQKGNIYQSIAISAFILLLYQPGYLFQIGFQLSYVAVIGIVYLQPVIYKALNFKQKWIDKAWQLCSVTLAAQIFTLPLTLYYFGMFPMYFLLTNLIVLPFVPLVVGSGLGILILCSLIPSLNVLAWIPLGITWSFNLITSWVSQLPGAYTSGLYINPTQLFILSVFVLVFAYALQSAKKQWLMISLILLIILQVLKIPSDFKNLKEVKISHMNLSFGHFFHIKTGQKHQFISFDLRNKWEQYYGFYLEKYLALQGYKNNAEWIELGDRALKIETENEIIILSHRLNYKLQDLPKETFKKIYVDKLTYRDLKTLSELELANAEIITCSSLQKIKSFLDEERLAKLPKITEVKLNSYGVVFL